MPGFGMLEWCVVLQTLLPALLFVPALRPFRMIDRAISYVLPLLAWALVAMSGRKVAGGRKYLPAPWLLFNVVWLGVCIFHPTTHTLLAGTAEAVFAVSIICPGLWAAQAIRDRRQLGRMMILLLICNGAGALVGMGQVYRPDIFEPPSYMMLEQNAARQESLSFTTEDGRQVIRPAGLTDTPGGACLAGSIACLAGVAVAVRPSAWWKRLGGLMAAVPGLAVLYLSMVRSAMILLVVGMLCWAGLLLLRREIKKLTLLLVCMVILGVVGTAWAFRVGGASVTSRFLTLFNENAGTVYYSNRGRFLDGTFAHIDEYVLGAGLGRFGMINNYFGDPNVPPSRGVIWSELQITAWLFDGGVPLLVGSAVALVLAMGTTTLIALKGRDPEVAYWAGVLVVFGMFNVVACFGSMPFQSPMGVQFWVLMGAVFGADAIARKEDRAAAMAAAAARSAALQVKP